MAMLNSTELKARGFAAVGDDVQISDKASIYGASRIRIGNHVRIDDFCVLSAGEGGIEIGNHVHIAVFCSLIGAGPIVLRDFSGLSSRVSIYSSSDDYSGEFLTNPTVPKEYTGGATGPVILDKHVIIGAGSVVLPNVHLEEGVAIGALSLVLRNCASFGIYSGNPARRISDRRRDLLELEHRLIGSNGA
ncbi:acyltransferase [Leptothrix discophora]|uniref:Acyltransferase n=1 Tax=Leptothrix discophora TaxID=89 RepID=A0ABT9G050_LEPDI|nr:acyltransferase [Leptothrix discophora]MDP4299857.1 acyltransferase [Leptothrix discophora]